MLCSHYILTFWAETTLHLEPIQIRVGKAIFKLNIFHMIMTEKTETIQVCGDRKNTTRQKMYINIPKHTICYIKELRTTTLTLLQSKRSFECKRVKHHYYWQSTLDWIIWCNVWFARFYRFLESISDDMADGEVTEMITKKMKIIQQPERNPDPSQTWTHNLCWTRNLWVTQSQVLTPHPTWLLRLRNKNSGHCVFAKPFTGAQFTGS